jgi:C4-dicarboxylate-binding protein DctP
MRQRNYFTLSTTILLLICLSLFFFLGIAGAATKGKVKGPKYVALFGHPYSVGDPYELGARKFKEKIEKETNKKVEVQLFPAGQLGRAPEMFESAQVGAIHLVGCSTGMIGNFLPEIDILRVPYFFPGDYDKVIKIMNHTGAGEELGRGLGRINIKVLAWTTSMMTQYTCNEPIRKPGDFKGLKIRTMNAPIILENFKILGASPTPLPYFETYSALQLGMVDGQENPISSIVQMKFHEVQKYMTLSNHSVGLIPVAINKKWFERLPEDIQKIFKDAGREWGDLSAKLSREYEQKQLEWLRKNSKIKIIELTPQQRQAFVEATKPSMDAFIRLTGERGKEIKVLFEREIAKLR